MSPPLLTALNVKRILIYTSLLALAAVFQSRTLIHSHPMVATTFVVTNTNDGGPGSLRQAITDANNNPGTDSITFNLPGPSTKIQPVLALPVITDPVVIDGTTQPGFAGTPVIELNGSNSASGGIFIDAKNSTVRGLVINGFTGGGIVLGNNSGSDLIEGCYIGVDVTGTLAVANGQPGISVFSSNNIIGGATAGARNVISGNVGAGIQVELFCCGTSLPSITGNVIQGNVIGLNATGDKPIPNQREGVVITSAAGDTSVTGTTVGGTSPGARNVISGNHSDGVLLGSFTTTGNFVQGNYIGTDLTGTKAIPNDGNGVTIDVAHNNTIGGNAPGAGNVISGNGRNGSGTGRGAGIGIGGGNPSGGKGNVVQGNRIGLNANGDGPLGNLLSGISIDGGGSNNVIGGINPGEGNMIAYNGSDGIVAGSSASLSNTFRGNSIFANGTLSNLFGSDIGIDLGPFGPTPNDIGDADTGSNNLQNHPVMTDVIVGSSAISVKGIFNSVPNATFTLDFYANSACGVTGYGEGERWLGFGTVSTDSSGNVSFDIALTATILPSQVVTATATDAAGNTSEFSQCSPAPVAAPMQIFTEAGSSDPNQAAALDSVLLFRDPFPIVNPANLLNQNSDRNTRVTLFVSNLNDTAAVVEIHLVDSGGARYDFPAEDVRAVPNFNFAQVTFRLPDNIASGVCTVTITARIRFSNSVHIRIAA